MNSNLIGFTAEELEAETVSVLPDRRLMQTVVLLIEDLDFEVGKLLAVVDLGDLVPAVPTVPTP